MNQSSSILFVKNMVCPRCITAVQKIVDQLEIPIESIDLGKIELKGNSLNSSQISSLSKALLEDGFALLNDNDSQLIEQVKTSIIELVHHQDEMLKMNLSTFLSEKFKKDYKALSTLFSENENTTIEKYYIAQRIERAKELLSYGEMSIKEIAHSLHYSNVAHLSNQFKKLTGFTPSQYKDKQDSDRQNLTDVS